MNIILFSESDCRDEYSQIFFFNRSDTRYQHVKKVLRLKTGDSFKAGFINGAKGTAFILELSETELQFRFTPAEKQTDALFPLELIVGFPRPIQLKRCLKDTATLGISRIHLVPTDLGEASYLQSDLADKNEMQKFLCEGASQAGSTLLPQVTVYRSIKDFFETTPTTDTDVKIIFDVIDKTISIRSYLQQLIPHYDSQKSKIFLAIGNERGWTAHERNIFSENHFNFCSMGKRILKTETAVTSSVAIVLNTLGFWETENTR